MAKLQFEIRESSIDNLGAFALEDIPEGVFIIEYTGEIINGDEAEKRETINDEKGVTYIFCVDDDIYIDAAVNGNEARFINHSCDPNCDYEITDGRVFYYSNRLIKKGEELTIDYNYDPESKKEICRCGSKNCRGFINGEDI